MGRLYGHSSSSVSHMVPQLDSQIPYPGLRPLPRLRASLKKDLAIILSSYEALCVVTFVSILRILSHAVFPTVSTR